MSDHDFRMLRYATKIVSAETLFFEQVSEWDSKRQNLLAQLADIPTLLAAHHARNKDPHPDNTLITLVDMAPTIRLANAFEATANGLHATAEVAANFGNKASKRILPSSFNALRKRCEDEPNAELAISLGDLQWYRKIREIRTEWAHYSSTFIAENKQGERIACVKAFRRPSDEIEFPQTDLHFTSEEFTSWTRSALNTLDSFAGYLLRAFVLRLFDLNQTFVSAVLDRNGFPIVRENFRFEVESITVREYLRRGGIECEG